MLRKYINNIVCISNLKFHCVPCVNRIKPLLFLNADKIGVRYAGHSHWKNIAKTKAAKDMQKSKMYMVYIDLMRKAALHGPIDPKLNNKLASIIKQAQANNMPSATINRALNNIANSKKNVKRTWYEYKGTNGVLFLIQTATENRTKTRGELNSVFKKFQVKKTENIRSAFTTKGYVFAKPPEGVTDVNEKSLEDAIEVGAEEVAPDEKSPDLLKFVCEGSEVHIVKSKLETRNYEVENAEEVYIPRNPLELTDEEYETHEEIIQKLEEIPEVENIFVNLA